MMGFVAAQRVLVPELMDVEAVSQAELARCMQDLERLSRLTLGYRPTLRWLDCITRSYPTGSIIGILDIACGGGDMLRAVARWARARGRRVRLRGIDLNPDMIAIAHNRTPSADNIEYRVGDAMQPDQGCGHEVDLIISSLFLHHLDMDQAVFLLRWMHAHARMGWLVNDLHRHALSYAGLRLLTPMLRMHRFVQHDGPASVARGWSRAELMDLAQQAGISADRLRLEWHFPFRWALSEQAGHVA